MALREQPINTNMVQFALSQANYETFAVTIDTAVDGQGIARGRQISSLTNGHSIDTGSPNSILSWAMKSATYRH
ncbi:MAG: hypothetical protein ACRCVV_22170 [Shewanella sp.]